MSKDPDYTIKVEQAIAKKYGKEAVQHPKANWSDEKEKQYLSELKEVYSRDTTEDDSDKVETDGVFVARKLITRNSNRSCPVCKLYSFKSNDDVYVSKFGCCEACYVQWVEGREERWHKGWRPNS